MVQLRCGLSADSKVATIELEPRAKFTATQLEELLHLIAGLRALTKPPVPDENPTPQTRSSSVACIRWYLTKYPAAQTQIRLHLLHPGFGWVWIPLSEGVVTRMTGLMQHLLRNRPQLH